MNKADDLKRFLLQTVPGLIENPERLQLFVDRGQIAARATGSLSFEYRYALSVVLTDYAGDADEVIVPLLAWIATNQPDLLERAPNEPFAFEAEILDSDMVDLSFQLDLTERVAVTPKPGGGYLVDHLDEPSRVDEFEGVSGVLLWQLFLRDQLIAQTSDPDFIPPAE